MLDASPGELGLEVPDDISLARFDSMSTTISPHQSSTAGCHTVNKMIAKMLNRTENTATDPEAEAAALRLEGRTIVRGSIRTRASMEQSKLSQDKAE